MVKFNVKINDYGLQKGSEIELTEVKKVEIEFDNKTYIIMERDGKLEINSNDELALYPWSGCNVIRFK